MPTLPTTTSAAQSRTSVRLFAATAAVSTSVILALSFGSPASAQDATTTTVGAESTATTTLPAETPVATTTPESSEATTEESTTDEAVTEQPAQEDPVPEGGVDAGFGGAAPDAQQPPLGVLILAGAAVAGGSLAVARRRKLSRFE